MDKKYLIVRANQNFDGVNVTEELNIDPFRIEYGWGYSEEAFSSRNYGYDLIWADQYKTNVMISMVSLMSDGMNREFIIDCRKRCETILKDPLSKTFIVWCANPKDRMDDNPLYKTLYMAHTWQGYNELDVAKEVAEYGRYNTAVASETESFRLKMRKLGWRTF